MSRTHRWLPAALAVACWLLPAPLHSADDPTQSGASWWRANQAKYPNTKKIDDLEPVFRAKAQAFLDALRAAGASVRISSTRRSPERAYLMHYSWLIAKGRVKAAAVPPRAGVTIKWDHGTDAESRKAAQEMVDLFGMVHSAALASRHIEGKAVDMSIAWTGGLKIKNMDGRMVVITSTPRDGGNADVHSIGAGYGVHKLVTDPPHWSVDGR